MLCGLVLCCLVLSRLLLSYVVWTCLVLCCVARRAAEEGDASLLSPAAREGLALVDEQGGSALTTALKGNHSHIAALLLRLGANPNDQYKDSEVGEVVTVLT
jgi:hypothetical protein